MRPNHFSQRILARQRTAADNHERAQREGYFSALLRDARRSSGLDEDTGMPPPMPVVSMLGDTVTGFGFTTDHPRCSDFEPVNVRQQAAGRLREWGRKRMAEIRAICGVLS